MLKFAFYACREGSLLLLKGAVLAYRWIVSPLLPPRCRFLPTCSEYALDALRDYGPYKGSLLTLKRVCRCHPWGNDGFDPLKEKKDA